METKVSKKKKVVVLSVVLALLIAAGATLAYLSAMTEQKENAFSFAENIKGRLDEPNWDPREAENLIPGYEVPKDPIITNVSNNGVDEFVAIRVNFTDGHGEPLVDEATSDRWVGRLLRLIDIDWNTDDWQLVDTDMDGKVEQIWVYKDQLAPSEVSTPLFNSVTVKPAFTAEEMTADPTLDWEAEYAWLASIVMTHTDDCYVYGACDCDVTYRHHTKCAIYGETGAENIATGGSLAGVDCDCTAVEIHESGCPAVVATLSGTCGHTGDGIDGFQIILRGAVVQAGVDGMDAWDDQATFDALVALFEANPYVAP
ncbi:MAG: hypothetical protein LBB42_01820 [Coriobacteriales bacterium]|jgi:predicted ribosomally synthesized peptide with SipW-like signal peptide|nr:hypothetical protein [Coriobacteriales bacterium]